MARKRKILPLLEAVEISGVAAEGKALARVALDPSAPDDKIVVFVPFGAPHDIADIKIDRRRSGWAEGHIERLITPSPLRVIPPCAHFGTCGGCKWQHLPYNEQITNKQRQVQDALERIAKVELPAINPILGCENIWHYRNKMEYTFSSRRWRTWEEVKSGQQFDTPPQALGFHIPGAFDKVLHIDRCFLQDSLGDEIRHFVYDYAIDHNLDFYDIKAGDGLLRTMMIRIASTGQLMICLQFGREPGEHGMALMEALRERFPDTTSLLYAVNTKGNDSLQDVDINVFSGREYIEERMENLTFRVGAKSFYQTNSAQALQLYRQVRRMSGLDNPADAEKRPLVYDLYTGTGTIASFVARACSRVIGIEYVEDAIADARRCAEANALTNTLFIAGDMKDVLTDTFVDEQGRPDIIIADPPRAGMHPDVIEVIKRAAPRRIVYVSCNPATQARDLAMLDSLYKVVEVQPVDMFPHTHHVENIVSLERR